MANYLLQFGGELDDAFPWSCNAVGVSSDSESAVATAWDAAIVAMWELTAFAAYVPTTTKLTFTSASTASATFKQTTKTSNGHSTAGTSASPSLPFQICEVVTLRTALATRYGRGRWYLPALASNALASGGFSMLPAAQTAIADAVDAMFSALGSTIQLNILHRHGGGGGTVAVNSLTPINACDIPDGFDTQRRRGDKRVPARVTVTV